MALSEFGIAFLDNLRDLTGPDRRSIVTLKDLAFENTTEATSVVRAIRQHVKQCPPAHRLPALYLVDCMLKTEPCPPVYVEQLGQALLEIFVFMWDNASDTATRATLTKVCKLWRSVAHLDQKVVKACETYMVPAGQASTSAGVPAMGGVLPPPGYRGYLVTQPPRANAAYGRPMATVGNGVPMNPRMVVHSAPQLATAAQYIVAPTARPAYSAAPQAQAVLYTMQTYVQPQPLQQHVQYDRQQQLAYARPPAPKHHANVSAPGQLPAAKMPVVLAGAHASSSFPSVRQHGRSPASPQQEHSSPQQQLPQSSGRSRSTEFPGPQALKELDRTAVQDLLDASSRTRPAFLDAAYLRNKRRTAQASTGLSSRQWYPSVDIWLVSTTADLEQEADEVEDAEEEELYFVEEDQSQPECAISGEPFERFYDPDSDKWCYKDAVMLLGDDAAKYGAMNGSIVKVQCLAGAPSKRQKVTLRTASASAAAGDALREAAAAAGSSGCGTPTPALMAGDSAPQGTGTAHGTTQTAGPPAAATTAQLPQPAGGLVKEEEDAGMTIGAVTDFAYTRVSGAKRSAGAVDAGTTMPSFSGGTGFEEAKRVKLEVQ